MIELENAEISITKKKINKENWRPPVKKSGYLSPLCGNYGRSGLNKQNQIC